MLTKLFRLPLTYRFCVSKFANETEYLEVACSKISQLTSITENFEEKYDLDYTVTDQILRINFSNHSIVINTQTPNRQLWYSSTISGPQRFDYNDGKWVNKTGGVIDDILHNDLSHLA